MHPAARQLQQRTFELARRSAAFVRALPRGNVEFRIGCQLVDSATSVAAHYRAACRRQSTRDFIAKMCRLEEEADESALWLALLRASGLSAELSRESEALEAEFGEITAIAVASVKTARARLKEDSAVRRPSKSAIRNP